MIAAFNAAERVMASPIDALSWDDLRLIRAIATEGTLPGAARALRLDHSTVFRRLRHAEAAAGLALFERDRQRLVPTLAGAELTALALRLGQEIDAASLRMAGAEPALEGEIRVTTNDSLLLHLLTPAFAGFRRRHPRIRLDVLIANQALNLSRRDADVAVRATDRPPDTLVGRKAARIAWALYGARDGSGDTAGDWVALGETMGALKVVRRAVERVPEARLAYRVDSVLALAAAVEAGLGVGHLPCFVADVRPGLRRLGAPEPEFATDLWLLTHADLRRAPRVRALLDDLATAMSERRALIEGEEPQPDQP